MLHEYVSFGYMDLLWVQRRYNVLMFGQNRLTKSLTDPLRILGQCIECTIVVKARRLRMVGLLVERYRWGLEGLCVRTTFVFMRFPSLQISKKGANVDLMIIVVYSSTPARRAPLHLVTIPLQWNEAVDKHHVGYDRHHRSP